MNKFLPAVLAMLAVIVAVSCAPQNPARRISKRPAAYERLTEKDKQLVSNGEIAQGMDQEAVALAWGEPSDRVEGLRNGERMERWDYRESEPVMSSGFFGGYGSGTYGSFNDSGIGAGIGPEFSYVPVRKATVWFVGGRVEEWERAK